MHLITNHLVTSWDIQVGVLVKVFLLMDIGNDKKPMEHMENAVLRN